jgi:ankyrin repeat protein
MNRYWITPFLAFAALAVSCSSSRDLDLELVNAVRSGNAAAVEDLLAAGANINSQPDISGFEYTPLQWAIMHDRSAILERLLAENPDYGVTDNNGYGLVHTAVNHKKPECLKILTAAAAPLDTPGTLCGRTPLYYAVVDNQPEMIEWLLGHDCDPKVVDGEGNTLLHKAAFFGHAAVCKVLLAEGLDPNAPNNAGATPLGEAQKYKEQQCVEILSPRE